MTTTDRSAAPDAASIPMSFPMSFPMSRATSRGCPFAPPDEYEGLRAAGGMAAVRLPGGRPAWVVTRHAEAEQVYTDARITTDSSKPGFPTFSTELPDPEELAAARQGMFIDMDPPEHDRYRRMLIPEFSVRRINLLRPRIQQFTDRLVDGLLEAGPRPEGVDLVESFGLPLPSLVICELLGVPYADHDFFQSRTKRMVTQVAADSPDDAHRAAGEIRAYLGELVRRAEREPGDDLTGRLVVDRLRTGALTREALVGMLFLLLVAGHETTANMIPLGVLSLTQHPEQLAALQAEPAGWPAAVEELLRYHSIVDWAAGDRMALEDLRIGETPVRAGDGIFVLNASANHDERVFDRPGDLDVRRDARRHLAFGYGVHQCLGQNLARAELEIAYRTLLERLPGLCPAVPVEELPFKHDAAIYGLYRLPVTW